MTTITHQLNAAAAARKVCEEMNPTQTSLELSGPLTALPANLPKHVTHLKVAMTMMRKMTVPAHIVQLDVFCGDVTDFSFEENSKLEWLRISQCPVHTLPKLPDTLTYLDVSFNDKFVGLSKDPLPPMLRYLNVNHTDIWYLPAMPDTLYALHAQNTYLEMIPPLGRGIGALYLEDCDHIRGQPPRCRGQYDMLNYIERVRVWQGLLERQRITRRNYNCKEELVQAVFAPERVAKWDEKTFDMMFGAEGTVV